MKRALTIAVLLWVALWPLGHRLLVARYDVGPWKLGGWAMYSAPAPPVLVALFDKRPEGWVHLAEETLEHPVRQALDDFRERREVLGRLLPPDELGRLTLALRPRLAALSIVVQRPHLDPSTARIVEGKDIYDYERSSQRR